MLDQTVTVIPQFLNELRSNGFRGEIEDDAASRLVAATDNSIYQIEPDAILFPSGAEDVELAVLHASMLGVALTARGGGTGTNGQSLNSGVVLDLSRHMTRILALDLEAGTVAVEPGVVLDQLNTYLKPHGVFFAPTVSTSSRATLGGMFATDASGKGSRIYGRTSDHVVAADVVLADGSTHRVSPEHTDSAVMSDIAGWLAPELVTCSEAIDHHFPKINRSLTGYNLDQARCPGTGIDFVKLLAGSEGTLALTTRLVLRLTPVPAYRSLTVLAYENCAAALEHVPFLAPAQASAIEFLDDNILSLAASSPMWGELESVLGNIKEAGAFLFVEFTGSEPSELLLGQRRLSEILDRNQVPVSARVTTDRASEMHALWEMRKRSVGLLAAMETERRGIPFVEDAAVPQENLAEFVAEFAALLARYGLNYGMFGHADVGCVHVRPMLDMRSAADRSLIRKISDDVAELCRRHGGLIWGEHGKGMRGEYVETYVGPDLYDLMRRIKLAFDPENRLNPGKLVTAANSDLSVMRLDRAPMRGIRDEQVNLKANPSLDRALACNGNGACHNWEPDDPMCPSFKVTRDKRQAPKGRATLLREWARRRSLGRETQALEAALYDSLDTCLSCKSCTSQCPVRVDIPAMKSVFLTKYFETHPRSPRDRLLRRMEKISMRARTRPHFANLAMANPLARKVLKNVFGLVDVPRFSSSPAERAAREAGARIIRPGEDPAALGDRPVLVVSDSFTGVFETDLVRTTCELLRGLGFTVYITPPLANGKALQVRGYDAEFQQQRQKTTDLLKHLAAMGIPMVSLEPAVTDLFDKEFGIGPDSDFSTISLDRFLFDGLSDLPERPSIGARYTLFLHCTEKTADPATGRRWQDIFARLGLQLDLARTGCCGMAGLFGHEAEHLGMSRDLFDLSWREPLEAAGDLALATGFSCRSQAKRFADHVLTHPVSILLKQLPQPTT